MHQSVAMMSAKVWIEETSWVNGMYAYDVRLKWDNGSDSEYSGFEQTLYTTRSLEEAELVLEKFKAEIYMC